MNNSVLVVLMLAFMMAAGCGERGNKSGDKSVADKEGDKFAKLFEEATAKLNTFNNLMKEQRYVDGMAFYYDNQADILIALETSDKIFTFHDRVIIPRLHRLYKSPEAYLREVSIHELNLFYLESAMKLGNEGESVRDNYMYTLSYLAAAYQKSDQIEKALETSTVLLELLETFEDRDSLGYANTLHNTGIYHQEAKSYEKALTHFEKAHKIYKELGMRNTKEWENSVKRIKEVKEKI